MNYLLAIGIVLAIILGRAIYYQFKISYLMRVQRKYEIYLKSYDSKTGTINPDLKKGILEEKTELKKLFDIAGIPNQGESYMDPAGYGFVHRKDVKYFDNIHIPNADIADYFHYSFLVSTGYFKKRRNESFSIFYWILLILNLPKHIYQHYGKKAKGTIYTLIDIIYKIAFIFGVVYAIVTGVKIL